MVDFDRPRCQVKFLTIDLFFAKCCEITRSNAENRTSIRAKISGLHVGRALKLRVVHGLAGVGFPFVVRPGNIAGTEDQSLLPSVAVRRRRVFLSTQTHSNSAPNPDKTPQSTPNRNETKSIQNCRSRASQCLRRQSAERFNSDRGETWVRSEWHGVKIADTFDG